MAKMRKLPIKFSISSIFVLYFGIIYCDSVCNWLIEYGILSQDIYFDYLYPIKTWALYFNDRLSSVFGW